MKDLKKIAILLLIINFYACSHNNVKNERPNMLTYDEYLKKDIPLPYKFELIKGNKHLVYYGVKHSNNPNDSMFIDIENTLEKLKPDIAFNEGGNNWPIINNRDSTILLTGDPGFFRFICRKNNIKVTSIEPNDSLEYKYLLSKYKKNDVVLMYFCRQIEQLQHQESFQDNEFNKYMNDFLIGLKHKGMPLLNDEISVDYYIKYFEEFFKTKFNWKNFDPSNYQPIYSKTLLNEIMKESTYFRDRYIINKIEESLETNDKVMVVMGGSHLIIEEPVLRYIMTKYE